MSLEDWLYPWLTVYDRLPESLRRTLGGGYRLLPARVRWGAAYPDFRRLTEEVAGWDSERVRTYQLKELRRVLHHAASFCPWYQERFAKSGFRPERVHSLEDMKNCPELTKGEVKGYLEEMVSSEIPAKQRLYVTTGGSTGVPVGFYLQKGISRPKEQAYLEAMWRRAGYFDGARVALIRGQVTSSKAGGPITRYDATRNWLVLSSYHLTEARLPDYLEAIERFKPDLLHAYPSAALQLAEYLERSGQTWRQPLRALLCGSERLTMPQKRLLERVFVCRVYRWYGHAERVILAGEGADSEIFYFWPTYGFAEFGPPDEEGLREVIGTSFHNLAMPLIRYHTGDYVRMAEPSNPDSLEFPWPAAIEVAGREQEFLVGPGGRRISLTAINMHDAIFDDLFAVQFYQDQPGVAEFRYVPSPAFRATRLAAIESGIRRKLSDDFRITFREVAEVEKTPRGKHRWLVSRL